ncbi:transcription-repair coupling factor [Candidatus Margulisiibacteriota bacterium]
MKLSQIPDQIRRSPFFQDQLLALKRNAKAAFSGMVGASSAAVLAALQEEYPSLLVIVSSTGQAEALRSELEVFSARRPALFPAPDTLPGEEIEPSRELTGERLAILEQWNRGDSGTVVIAPVKAVMWRTSRSLESIRISLGTRSEDQNIRMEDLIEKLVESGYKRFDIVGERGEFSVRGGIVDIFPLDLDHPVRVEFLEDRVESLRSFDAYSQRSIKKLGQAVLLPAIESFEVPVFEHLRKDTVVVFAEVMEISRAADKQLDEQKAFSSAKKYLGFEKLQDLAKQHKRIEISQFLKPGEESGLSSPASYVNKISELPAGAVIVSKHAARLRDELAADIFAGSLRGGFVLGGLQVLSDRELFGEQVVLRKARLAPNEGVADQLLADLKAGDFVVHENYGIGLYQGMGSLTIDGVKQEYLILGFAQGDKVYVPPSQAGLVEKYSSGGDFRPKLSRLGTKQWLRVKGRVKKALRDMTKELLQLYAARQKLPGISFPPDDIWQTELEGTFPFEETPDQAKAICETKQDMGSSRPMDRLVCGDVGYGKTEVAVRAAAKAVSAGKQVAILVPTTILAEQHYNNFKARFSSSPFVIEMLSRFRSKKELAQTVKSLAGGGVDIVIGTHRLLSKDVKFKDLGLLIIDEEQRFGVAHKEKLKKLRRTVDVLTLTATPIPRTLYLSLSGARDMSTIHTPPVDRSPIRTYVLPWSEAVIREAVLRELDRGGQVYFVHNFVETIEGIAAKVKKLVPEARVTVGHGQMPEKELEKAMLDFLDRNFDVLVCTSIIESGLDITNVNTILIDQAERFGLSQLYQIRGRVGRSAARAYAYLFYHPQKVMTDQALERLKAIQEFTALGSGYKLAMRDLEIRGAGNLLGAEQSGHVMEVGFDLYCELLEEAVREVKGIEQASAREVEIDLKVEAFIPEDYITDERQRIAVYRRMNLLDSKAAVDGMKQELADRFGPIPKKLNKLFDLLYLKAKALKAGIGSIKEEDGWILVERLSGKRVKLKIEGQDKIKLAEKGIAG